MKKKILITATTFQFVDTFLIEFLISISKTYTLILVTNKRISKLGNYKNIKQSQIKFTRKISIFNDLKCLFMFLKIIIKHSPDTVISFTPKAGLISSLSSFLTFRKNRIHYFTGQIWANENNLIDSLIKFFDKLISRLSTHIICDSFGQKKFLIKKKIIQSNKIHIIHNGSIKGINCEIFKRNYKYNSFLKKKHSLKKSDKIILIVSRLNKDKGIENIPLIVNPILKKNSNIYVFVIGQDENNYKDYLLNKIFDKNKIKFVKKTNKLNRYLNISEILLITSLREGFGNIALEASASETPIVSNNIYGLEDIVINNINGLRYSNNSQASDNIIKLINNKKLCLKLGNNGRKIALSKYDHKFVNYKLCDFIKKIVDV